MSYEEKLLKKIYDNAKTGERATEAFSSRARTKEFEKLLRSQRDKYYEIANEAYVQLRKKNEKPEDFGLVFKLSESLALGINSFGGREEKMAELLIEGSTEGIIDIKRALKNGENTQLADKLIEVEEENIKLMQEFV